MNIFLFYVQKMKELFFLIFLVVLCGNVHAANKKVLLSDVSTITLKAGEMTAGRRSSPVTQMKCVGGAAAGKYKPRVAQCTKVGFDGLDYQWRCTAEMPTEYEFGRITVSCEGYDHPDDPYILHGSCGLEYELEYTADLKRRTPGHNETSNTVGSLAVIAFIVVVAIFMFYSKNNRDDREERGRYSSDGPDFPPGGDGQDYHSKPPRQPSPPPSYDDSCNTENIRRRGPSTGAGHFGWNVPQNEPRTMGRQGGGPGFWTGAGLGALGGYFMGRRQGQQQETRTAYSQGFRRSTPTPPPSTRSSDMHQSTGYGGTARR